MKTNRLVVGLLPILIAIPTAVFRSFQAHYPEAQSISATLPSSSDLPVAYFDASVAQLRIRKYPDLNATVIAEVPEGGRLKYLNETGGTPIEVTLRGIKHRGRWYKVAWDKNNNYTKAVEGWVFTGGVVLSSIHLNGTPPDQLNFDFFKANKLSKAAFDAQAVLYKNDFKPNPNPNPYAKKKGPIVLPLNNGKVKMISDSLCKEPTSKPLEYDQYYYTGQFPTLGLYFMNKMCDHRETPVCYLISKSDGKIVMDNMGSDIPLFSPDGQKTTLLFNEGCGGFRVDFGIFRNNNWSILSIMDDDGYLEEVIWSQDSQQCLVKWNFYAAAGEKTATEYYSIPFGPLE